jgi:hypothetical protein
MAEPLLGSEGHVKPLVDRDAQAECKVRVIRTRIKRATSRILCAALLEFAVLKLEVGGDVRCGRLGVLGLLL